MTLPTFKLSSEEIAILMMMRKNSFQEIIIQIKDLVVISVDQVLMYRRKKDGGLVAGHLSKPTNINLAVLNPDEAEVIKMIRDKPHQQITIQIKNSIIEALNQTVKFRKTNGFSSWSK